jgi:DNA-binding NarL/FixJ family response regulator
VTVGESAPPYSREPEDGRLQVGFLDLAPIVARGLKAALAGAGFDIHDGDQVTGWGPDGGHRRMVLTPDEDASFWALEQLQNRVPGVLSVALLQEADTRRYARALARCTGAVPLDAELDDVVASVWAAARGRALLPTSVVRELAARAETGEAVPDLTEQQIRWLRALASSATVTSLAKSAGYSEREMYRLLSALYARLGVTTRTEALLRADRWGLLRERPPTASGPSVDLTAHDRAGSARPRR